MLRTGFWQTFESFQLQKKVQDKSFLSPFLLIRTKVISMLHIFFKVFEMILALKQWIRGTLWVLDNLKWSWWRWRGQRSQTKITAKATAIGEFQESFVMNFLLSGKHFEYLCVFANSQQIRDKKEMRRRVLVSSWHFTCGIFWPDCPARPALTATYWPAARNTLWPSLSVMRNHNSSEIKVKYWLGSGRVHTLLRN